MNGNNKKLIITIVNIKQMLSLYTDTYCVTCNEHFPYNYVPLNDNPFNCNILYMTSNIKCTPDMANTLLSILLLIDCGHED